MCTCCCLCYPAGVCHAICNAILASPSPDLRHCILYSLYFPCNKCAQVIVQSGIRQVLYTEDKSCSECDDSSVVKASKRVLNNARVFYRYPFYISYLA